MIHKNKLNTRSYFINRFGELSDSYLFYQMQDIAWEHANLLGFGYDKLKVDQQFWVLSRMYIKIKKRPKWGEDFELETWSRGADRFFGYRDYFFTDTNGNHIIEGTTSWLVLDLNSKKIVNLTEFENFPKYEESVFGKNAGKVKAPKSDDLPDFTPVRFNEIDINQHFNTGRYIERIIDSYDFDFHEKHELAELEINFLKEGMPTDRLGVKRESIDEKNHICSVVRERDGEDLIRAKLVWCER